MSDEHRRALALGRIIAEGTDRLADPAALPKVRARVLQSAPPPARRRAPVVAAAVIVAAVVLFAVHWLRQQPESALTFEVGEPPRVGAIGEWLAPSAGQELTVQFSEGTRLTLADGARLRVTRTSERGANVLLEKGSVHARVMTAAADPRWSCAAGPFVIEVTGTAFKASWDPVAEQLELVVQEGSVMVRGPVVEEQVLRGGQRLRVSVADARAELRAGEAAPSASAAPSVLPSAEPVAEQAEGGSSPTGTSTASEAVADQHGTSLSWQRLASEGRHADAMQALDDAAFGQALGSASAGTLRTLADSARFGGRPDRARQALLALRGRHGARGETAFLLGKVAADQLGASGEAARWFQTYLHEAPNGPLAEQAMGRLLELHRHGDPALAAQLAERYLSQYPHGSYAPLARRLAAP